MSAREELFEQLRRSFVPSGDLHNMTKAWRLIDRYRSEVLNEAADKADAMAAEFRSGDDSEWPEEWSSREVMDAVGEVAAVLSAMAREVKP